MPKIAYKNSAGGAVPGVTTVLNNLGWKTPGLLFWANQLGLEGKKHTDVVEAAADAGTLAHLMVEHDLLGAEPPDINKYEKEIAEKACVAFSAWNEWKSMVNFEVIATELQLVSELHQFGGTLDIALVMGNRRIIDLKTSKAVYADHKIQVSAYMHLYNENYPDEPIADCHILQLGKEDGSFSHHYYPDLTPHFEVFKHLLEIHRLKKVVGK